MSLTKLGPSGWRYFAEEIARRVETLSGVSPVPMPAAAPDGTGGTEPCQ
jgi:hypothetical protein